MAKLSARNIPTGEGSRGGHWHEDPFRRAYHKAWKAAHPEYRERERLRKLRARAAARGDDPTLVTATPERHPMRRRTDLPVPTTFCRHGCACHSPVPLICGFCREGLCEA